MKITREFFQRDPRICSRELIGCELLWNGAGGVIVETEAETAEAARARIVAMCEKLLANPVTEDFEIASVERA